jgi:FkbM family methyltransferase
MLLSRGMSGGTANWYCGLGEPAEMAFVLHALRPGELFLDVGANLGSFTLLAAAAGAEIISIEPVPETYVHLIANIRLNGLSQCTPLNCGVSNQPGYLTFTLGRDCQNRVIEDGPGVTLPVDTIDNICAARVPTVMKIDVEGHEPKVLEGARMTFASPELQAVVIEMNDRDWIRNFMAEHNFSEVDYDWRSRRLSRAERNEQDAIFVRDVKMMEAQCCTAPYFNLVNGTI